MVNTQQSELKTSADLGKSQNRMLAQSQKKAQMTGTILAHFLVTLEFDPQKV